MAKVYARAVNGGRYIGAQWFGGGDVFVMDETAANTYSVKVVQGWDTIGGSFVILGPAPDDAPLGPVPDYGE